MYDIVLEAVWPGTKLRRAACSWRSQVASPGEGREVAREVARIVAREVAGEVTREEVREVTRDMDRELAQKDSTEGVTVKTNWQSLRI